MEKTPVVVENNEDTGAGVNPPAPVASPAKEVETAQVVSSQARNFPAFAVEVEDDDSDVEVINPNAIGPVWTRVVDGLAAFYKSKVAPWTAVALTAIGAAFFTTGAFISGGLGMIFGLSGFFFLKSKAAREWFENSEPVQKVKKWSKAAKFFAVFTPTVLVTIGLAAYFYWRRVHRRQAEVSVNGILGSLKGIAVLVAGGGLIHAVAVGADWGAIFSQLHTALSLVGLLREPPGAKARNAVHRGSKVRVVQADDATVLALIQKGKLHGYDNLSSKLGPLAGIGATTEFSLAAFHILNPQMQHQLLDQMEEDGFKVEVVNVTNEVGISISPSPHELEVLAEAKRKLKRVINRWPWQATAMTGIFMVAFGVIAIYVIVGLIIATGAVQRLFQAMQVGIARLRGQPAPAAIAGPYPVPIAGTLVAPIQEAKKEPMKDEAPKPTEPAKKDQDKVEVPREPAKDKAREVKPSLNKAIERKIRVTLRKGVGNRNREAIAFREILPKVESLHGIDLAFSEVYEEARVKGSKGSHLKAAKMKRAEEHDMQEWKNFGRAAMERDEILDNLKAAQAAASLTGDLSPEQKADLEKKVGKLKNKLRKATGKLRTYYDHGYSFEDEYWDNYQDKLMDDLRSHREGVHRELLEIGLSVAGVIMSAVALKKASDADDRSALNTLVTMNVVKAMEEKGIIKPEPEPKSVPRGEKEVAGAGNA